MGSILPPRHAQFLADFFFRLFLNEMTIIIQTNMLRCITCNLLKGSTHQTSATPPPPPWQSDVRDPGWEGPQAPPVAARTSRLRRLAETVAACLASELLLWWENISRSTFFFSICPDTESCLFSHSLYTFSPKHDTHYCWACN